ncbi:hypothetical protein MKX01_041243, partial [Papaver californicum]
MLLIWTHMLGLELRIFCDFFLLNCFFVVPNEKGFICLKLWILNSKFGNGNDFIEAAMGKPVITIDKTPKKTTKTPVSKQKSVRRSA